MPTAAVSASQSCHPPRKWPENLTVSERFSKKAGPRVSIAGISGRRGADQIAAVVAISPIAVVVPAHQAWLAVGVGVAVAFPDIAQVDCRAAVVVTDARIRMIFVANLPPV